MSATLLPKACANDSFPCLGIDLGTDGLSAAWGTETSIIPLARRDHSGSQRFRQPAAAWLSPEQAALVHTALPICRRRLAHPVLVGEAALHQASRRQGDQDNREHGGVLLQGFKPLLSAGMPWIVPGTADLEPRWQLNETVSLPLVWVVKAIAGLLGNLSERSRQAQQVVLARPTLASTAWLGNVRSAAIAAGLVAGPEELLWLEEPIAAGLGWLALLPELPTQGALLVVHAGATTTQLGVLALPVGVAAGVSGFALGSRGLALEAIAHCLCPTAAARAEFDLADLPELDPGQDTAAEQLRWRLRLASSDRGRALLGAAERLALQLADGAQEVGLTVGDRRADQSRTWQIAATDSAAAQLLPGWLGRLDLTINELLVRQRLDSQAIHSLLLTGRLGATTALANWLAHKFPGAHLHIDRPDAQTPISLCRRALGLAALPRFPQLAHTGLPSQEPYGDEFLLRELLRLLPPQPLPFDRLLAELEAQGTHTRTCGDRLRSLLMGHLPPGILPDDRPGSAISPASLARREYQELRQCPPFRESPEGCFEPDPEAALSWRRYLNLISLN